MADRELPDSAIPILDGRNAAADSSLPVASVNRGWWKWAIDLFFDSRFADAVFVVLAAWALWLRWHPPSPGFSATILAVVAGFMGIRDLGKARKALWTVLTIGLLLVELHSIAKQGEQQAVDRKHDQDTFSGIAKDLKRSSTLAETSLNAIAGTGSVPCVVPQPVGDVVILNVWNRGHNLLTSVEIQVLSQGEFLDGKSIYAKQPYVLGTLTGLHAKQLRDAISPLPRADGIAYYTLRIWAQNGYYTEQINFRKSKRGFWDSQYWLVKQPEYRTGDIQPPATPEASCERHEWVDDWLARQRKDSHSSNSARH